MAENPKEALDVNIRKIEASLLAVDAKIDEVDSAILFGIWKDKLVELYSNLLKAIRADLRIFLSEALRRTNNPLLEETIPDFVLLSEEVNNAIDGVLHHIDNTINTTYRLSPMHEYISYVLRDLELSDNVRYYICTDEALATKPIVKYWTAIFREFAFFDSTRAFLSQYVRDYRGFFIITIPPLVVQKKEYWPAIVHELGHIILEYFSIIENHYDYWPISLLRTGQGQEYYHSREHASDYIANAYSGPCILEILREYLFSPIVMVGEEHPPWDARLFYLQDVLSPLNKGRVMVERTPHSPHTSLKKLPDIIKEVGATLNDNLFFKDNPVQAAKVVQCLKNGIPFIGPPPILLNEYVLHKHEILAEVKRTLGAKGINREFIEIERNVGSLIEDSIRMTNMERTFKIMVSSPKESTE
jgi:hypothetical protein